MDQVTEQQQQRGSTAVRVGGARAPAPSTVAAGIVVVAAGFGALVLAWGRVAGLDDVTRQLPWAVGAGAGGIALIITGLAAVSIQSRRRDAAVHEEQLSRILQGIDDVIDVLAAPADAVSRNGRSAGAPARRPPIRAAGR